MRIAYIADAGSIHGHKWISHFAKHHDVILLCDENPPSLELYRGSPEVKIHPILPRTFPVRRIFAKQRAMSRLRSVIAEHRTQVIHSMYAVPNSFWAFHLGFKEHVVTTRGSDVLVEYREMRRATGGLSERITAHFLRRALEGALRHASYVTSTSTTQWEAIRHLVNPSRHVLVRTGVDVVEFLRRYENLKAVPAAAPLIFSNRAMLPNYDIGLIIDAFALLRHQARVPARLVTINYSPGQPYYSEIMNKIAASPAKDEIKVLEPRSQNQLLQLYKDASLVVMVPHSDGTPVTGVETLLTRRPLIMGPLEYDKDLFNSDTVWTLRSRSVEGLAETMAEVLRLPPDSIRRKTENGFRAAVENANLDTELAKIERLYASLS